MYIYIYYALSATEQAYNAYINLQLHTIALATILI